MTSGALLGWFALPLQFYLTTKQSMANGNTFLSGAIFYFSFFTILTNILIAAQFSFPLWLPKSRPGKWFSRPFVQAASAVYIAVVGGAYSLLLRHIWDPQGLQKLADIFLHDAIPLLYAGYWLLFAPKRGLRWTDAIRWLIYPLIYLVYSIGRGEMTGTYPYPFIDLGALGYARTMMSVAALTLTFLGVGLLVVALGRRMQSR